MDQSIESSFTKTSSYVHHMEIDLYRKGNILYTDFQAVQTSDGFKTQLIAGDIARRGYKEGIGKYALFSTVTGFIQLSANHVVVADSGNHCMRMLDRLTGLTSTFSGKCKTAGSNDGQYGRLSMPSCVGRDNRDSSQLLVTNYQSIRTVNAMTGVVGTFVRSGTLDKTKCFTQSDNGDIYLTAYHAIYRITYNDKSIKLLAGSSGDKFGYKENTLFFSLFSNPFGIMFIGPHTFLVADMHNSMIRLIDMDTDKVRTLLVCQRCMHYPTSLLISNNSLFVGQPGEIKEFMCEIDTIIVFSDYFCFSFFISMDTQTHAGAC